MLKIKDLDLLKDIDIIYKNKIILYGAGDYGKRAVDLLDKLDISILGFADSDEAKWGKVINGSKVFNIHELMRALEDKNIIIIITMADPNNVEQVLSLLDERKVSKISCYTYFALKHAVELNITDKRIPKAYQEEVNILKKIYSESINTSVELDGLSSICDILLYDKKILILQPGKVGSTSVRASLEKAGIDYAYAHTLTDTLWGSKLLKERISGTRLLRGKKIKLITMIRDPISRDISLYFFQLFFEYALMDLIQADTNKGINEYLEKNAKVGGFGWIFEWFDTQIRDVFGIDIFKCDFDKTKGYQVIKEKNVEILLIKTEKLDECQEVIGKFLGNEDFELVKGNIGNDKLYKFAYNEIKKTIRIPKHIIDFYYKDNQRMDHFYTIEEKEQFYRKWSGELIREENEGIRDF